MLMLVMLPMWMNFLLRTYAWMGLLSINGPVNAVLGFFGLGPYTMLNTSGAVVLGMVYNYVPYMILPLYTSMTKIDQSLVEAAQDLGASTTQTLFRVLIPMSVPGISTGITMVFVPAVSTFVISRMLGGGSNLMIAEGMLAPLDYSNIPNSQNIDAVYRDPDYDPTNAYTVPYMLCTTGIIYNTTMVENAPTKWADLWDEQYAGNILMFNNSRDAYAIAAFKNGTSINPETPEEVDEVVETLKAQKPLVQAYVMDEIFDKMIGGEAAIGVYYSGDAITMIDDNPDLAWVFPEEGSVLSVDCMAVPATSEHKEAAEMFINFMCEPDIGKANAEYIGYTTPMQKVWDILDEDLKYSEIAYPSEEVEAKEKVFTALSDEVNNELDVKWSEMKSYNEGGSGVVFLMLLLAMVALACFNIWRKLRKKTRNQY